jgi:hypothetical protein
MHVRIGPEIQEVLWSALRLGVHLHVGAFDHLLQPVAGPAGGDAGRDAELEVGIILVVELDQAREGGKCSFAAGDVGRG